MRVWLSSSGGCLRPNASLVSGERALIPLPRSRSIPSWVNWVVPRGLHISFMMAIPFNLSSADCNRSGCRPNSAIPFISDRNMRTDGEIYGVWIRDTRLTKMVAGQSIHNGKNCAPLRRHFRFLINWNARGGFFLGTDFFMFVEVKIWGKFSVASTKWPVRNPNALRTEIKRMKRGNWMLGVLPSFTDTNHLMPNIDIW